MKLLIITAPLGNGHNAVASAVSDCFTQMYPEAECKILDMYEYISPALKKATASGYFLSMKTLSHMHGVASTVYDLQDEKEFNEYTPSRLTDEFLASRLRHAIRNYAPDCIVCTMVYAAQAVDLLKERGAVSCPCYGIITDFTVQNYWCDVEYFEYIVAPSEYLEPQFLRREIDFSRVLPYGIPIRDCFRHKQDQADMRHALGLDANLPTILIMSGGMGFGDLPEYIASIENLPFPIQMMVICGSNEKLYQTICSLETKNPIKVFGYVKNVDEIMDAADCLLSKPGGITTSESLAKGLPMLMINPLPGVEDRNVEFLQANGAAIFITKTFQIADAMHLLFRCPGRLDRLKASIQCIAKPNAAFDLCQHIGQTIVSKSEES
ncbi:MAG: glycosyltransferase [Eubacteriales bacterium]|nr:glycosyltransferase [Eubacteriales bacterium]